MSNRNGKTVRGRVGEEVEVGERWGWGKGSVLSVIIQMAFLLSGDTLRYYGNRQNVNHEKNIMSTVYNLFRTFHLLSVLYIFFTKRLHNSGWLLW